MCKLIYFHGNVFTTRSVCIRLARASRDFNEYFNEYFDEIVFKFYSTVLKAEDISTRKYLQHSTPLLWGQRAHIYFPHTSVEPAKCDSFWDRTCDPPGPNWCRNTISWLGLLTFILNFIVALTNSASRNVFLKIFENFKGLF